ncbi:NDP-hexose 2,3-dehydratase family protein [Amycolatopsis magusensis]|uniref:Oxidase EvaA n=1 Tax=Amycolatopsis magusensis TaxID=882444 RepID=A0ABS4PR54_9PSEU|nr:NDP-hexose 2,3-dehydratase family protein [Amycolatopsis magusensis]MBP2181091.1 oxidase EvaA [Amycolatopsis magusensis]MDI5981815.1 NDP-hexose 2,3-dehydratase family protein [Amycolatopsis magusensis]
MSTSAGRAEDFLASALTTISGQTEDPDLFLKQRFTASSYQVDEIPLDTLGAWRLGDRLEHNTGRFFTIEGLSVRTSFGPNPQWCQPIIVQPDIGILGILVKKIDGVHHFLMQVKMEPGNSTLVQYAATVQATQSNYQRVHGGRPTPYLEYFLKGSRGHILVDRLLSEHASWYLHKRNRNMIVEIPPDEDVEERDDFAWLTLGQLRRQLALGNVNMNARTVLACVSYDGARAPQAVTGFHAQTVASHNAQRSDAHLAEAMTWLIDQKETYTLDVKRIGLSEMDGWAADDGSIRHRDGLYFRIIGLSVAATSREVGTWSQPMLEPVPGNLVAFLCQRQNGVLRFLTQAMIQPGSTDRLELGASIQLAPGYCRDARDLPPLVEYLDSAVGKVRMKSLQSEDGGRFHRADTEHLVIELPEDHHVEAPENYRWMTLGLLGRLMQSGYYLNVEARSLMACLL